MQVLFRSGVLSQLEGKRDELLSDRIIQLQAYCRGHLARKRVAQKRVQELAVRCIQRNVRAFLQVRDWPWWRLLVRVTPLLNVHRTEEQLKIANDELQALKMKLDKMETDRNTLKTENLRLEAKVSELLLFRSTLLWLLLTMCVCFVKFEFHVFFNPVLIRKSKIFCQLEKNIQQTRKYYFSNEFFNGNICVTPGLQYKHILKRIDSICFMRE